MQIFIDSEGTIGTFMQTLNAALETDGLGSLLILSCAGNGYTPEDMDPILKKVPVPLFGGIFPMVLGKGQKMERGSVIVAMEREAEVQYIQGLSDPKADYEDILDAKIGDDDFKTLMVFVDGTSRRISAFIESLYAVFGLEMNYVGGGAGSLSFKREACIFTNQGLMEDGAVLAAFDIESGVGVSHGWDSISGPYKVTESERNVIKSLDWRPAFDVYKSVVEEHSGTPFVSLPFFDIAKAYPFGIAKQGSDYVVRDTLTLDGDQNLICVGEVPEGVYVDILHADPAALIRAAGGALELARTNFPSSAVPGMGLLMDCISRVLFLDDAFNDELKEVMVPGLEFVGACSIGEIANNGNDFLEFYNKTTVVAFLELE